MKRQFYFAKILIEISFYLPYIGIGIDIGRYENASYRYRPIYILPYRNNTDIIDENKEICVDTLTVLKGCYMRLLLGANNVKSFGNEK